MKTYVMTTGAVFGLLTFVHVLRVFQEGLHLATEPFFVGSTVLAAILCLWACRLILRSPKP